MRTWLGILFALLVPSVLVAAPNPALVALQARPYGLYELALIDLDEQAAQRALVAAVLTNNLALSKARATDYKNTWLALDQLRNEVWASAGGMFSTAVFIQEPLTIAALDLHIGVRRRLGPDFKTVVPGLDTAPGCEVDIIASRIIYDYGSAAASAASQRFIQILEPFARHVACMSERQLADFEWALHESFDAVAQRLLDNGRIELVEPFARLVAPLMTFLHDARKYRGESSLAFQWFDVWGNLLEGVVAKTGWPTGNVYLWNRQTGALSGFPVCATASSPQPCVDLIAFLRSLRDPRALAFGDCALTAMVARGPKPAVGPVSGGPPGTPALQNGLGSRYVCPVPTCGTPTQPAQQPAPTRAGTQPAPAPAANAQTIAALQALWGSLPKQDVSSMETICNGPGAAGDMQGMGPFDPACQEENPFDEHQTCVMNALTGQATEDNLAGVPQGDKCRFGGSGLANGAGDKPEPQTKPTEEKKGFWESLWDALFGSSDGEKKDPPPTSAGQNKKKTSFEQLVEEDAQRRENIQQLAKDTKKLTGGELFPSPGLGKGKALGVGKELLGVGKVLKPFIDAANRADENERKRNGGHACVDELACNDSCSGLGKQIKELGKCDKALMDKILTAIGRGKPGIDPKGKPRDIYSNPDPDKSTAAEVAAEACMPGSGGGGAPKTSSYCGLIMCADTSMASQAGEACGCVGRSPMVVLPAKHLMCPMIRCAEPNPQDPCICGQVEAEPIGSGAIGPGPDPLRPR